MRSKEGGTLSPNSKSSAMVEDVSDCTKSTNKNESKVCSTVCFKLIDCYTWSPVNIH